MVNLIELLNDTRRKRIDGVYRSQDDISFIDGRITALEHIQSGEVNKENLQAKIEAGIKRMKRAQTQDFWDIGYLSVLENFNNFEF